MNNKNVLITGANKSIGFETARELGLLVYKVWLGSRGADRGKSAVNSLTKEGGGEATWFIAIDRQRENICTGTEPWRAAFYPQCPRRYGD